MSASIRERNLAGRIEAHSMPEPNSGCWLWLGRLDRRGYGQLSYGKRTKLTAHRAAYQIAKGPVPSGLVLDHLCRVRCCINPDHIEAVTVRTNTLRGSSFAAQRSRATHCIHGHAFDEQNTMLYSGRRQCRTCHKAYKAARRRTKGGR